MADPRMTPLATYRLQFHAGFPFAEAEALVPYLADLGISHIYASPITMAAKGSTHGYDVIDPTRINPELGGEAGLRSLVAALRGHGMGLIIDIVPNHMGVAGDENPYWMDVLAHGRESRHAAIFDIDWRTPIIVPVLGSPPTQTIADGDVVIVPQSEGLGIRVHGGPVYPIRPDDPIWAEDRAATLARHASDTVEGRAAITALLERQHYRLIHWRGANDLLNWRRFFSINELAGVRVENPAVFDLTHGLFLRLFREGLIDGVRVDHVDGLADPAAYCRTLRAALDAQGRDAPAYIVVEKILAADEPLATDWGVDGTSGYDFMREMSALLHDTTGDAQLRGLWAAISGRSPDFTPEALEARRDLLAWQFEGQLVACVESLLTLAQTSGQDALTGGMLRRATERLLWTFPVYRTYGTGGFAPAGDVVVRGEARKAAMSLLPPGEEAAMDFILDALAGQFGETGEIAAETVRRFQQLSAPIAAKGVEDTAFYRHAALLSANDVGFDPGQIAAPVTAFHNACVARATAHPHAMLATATHDHKRGEDARARLAVLSAIPEIWAEQVGEWTRSTARLADGIDPADFYQLLQAIVGAWDDDMAGDALLARVQGWQMKLLREAKLRSSWEAPDEDYEARYADLATALLSTDGLRGSLTAFIKRLAPAAHANSMVQTFLHYTVPGVPDLYQGCELMDYSTVDPGNREPVEYAVRRALLAKGAATSPGAEKQALIRALLTLRQAHPILFTEGDYRPIAVTGLRAEHVVAFARGKGGEEIVCAAAIRLGASLFGQDAPCPDASWWGDTQLTTTDAPLARTLFASAPFHIEISTPKE